MTARLTNRRRGVTLAELLVSLVIIAIIGAALTKLTMSQARFFSQFAAKRSARSATRGAMGMMLADLRMVDPKSGIESATSTSIQVKAPYALGVACHTSGTTTYVSLFPADSAMFAGAAFSGYAWRDSTSGNYVYDTVASIAASTASKCTADSVAVLAGRGQVVAITSSMAAPPVGAPVFVYQELRYAIRNSAAVPGSLGIWRTVVATGAVEEIVAPFKNPSSFRFYVMNTDTAQTPVPTLNTIRGFEISLTGASPNIIEGRSSSDSEQVTTAVFLRNRSD